MARLLVFVLLIANLAYAAWAHRWLEAWGFAPARQAEPERLAQQRNPDLVKVLPRKEMVQAQEQARLEAMPKECWMAGPFEEAQLDGVRVALSTVLPADLWKIDVQHLTERWVVYMGKYADDDELGKKAAQLQTLGLRAIPAGDLGWKPGLYLGEYKSEEAAKKAMAKFAAKGVRTARVEQVSKDGPAGFLVLSAIRSDQKAKLDSLGEVFADTPLQHCP